MRDRNTCIVAFTCLPLARPPLDEVVDCDGSDDHQTGDGDAPICGHPEENQSVANHCDDERPENGTENGPNAAGQCRPADDCSRDHRQLEPRSSLGITCPQESQREDTSEPSDDSHQGHDHNSILGNGDAGKASGLEVASNGLDALPEGGVVVKDKSDRPDEHHPPNARWYAEYLATTDLEEPVVLREFSDDPTLSEDEAHAPVDPERSKGDDQRGNTESDA